MVDRTAQLIAFAALSSLGVGMVVPYLPLFGTDIGLPISLLGHLIFMYYGIEFLTRIPIGFLSDVLNPPLVIAVGAASFICASLFFLASPTIWYLLFPALFALAVGISVTWVTIPAFMTIMEGSLSRYTFSVGLGWLFGPPLGGFLRDSLGMGPLFGIFVLVSMLLAILAALFYGESRGDLSSLTRSPPPPIGEEAPSLWAAVPDLVSSSLGSFSDALGLLWRKKVLMSAIVSFIMFMSFAMGISLLPLYLSGIGLSSFLIGVLIFIRMGTVTLIRLASGRILKVGDEVAILLAGTALAGAMIFLVSATELLSLLVVLFVLWGLGAGIYLPVVLDLIAGATTEDERGVAMGLRGAMGTVGSAVGVLVFMSLADAFTVRSSLATFGIFVLASSAVLMLIWKFTQIYWSGGRGAERNIPPSDEGTGKNEEEGEDTFSSLDAHFKSNSEALKKPKFNP